MPAITQTMAQALLVLAMVSALSSPAYADDVPPDNTLKPITIGYTVNLRSEKLGNATLGKLESTLTKTDNGFSVLSITKAQGIAAILMGSNMQLSCQFSVEDGRAISSSYSGGRKDSEDYTASFDWKNRKISFQDGESLDMPQGYLIDDCNMPYAAALLKGEDLLDETLYVLDGKKKRLRAYKLKSTSKEMLETKIGNLETVKVVLEREFNPEKTFSLWLSPDNFYVPIKMEEKRKSRTTIFLANKIES